MIDTRPNRLADLMDLDLIPWLDGAMDGPSACAFLGGIDPTTLAKHVRSGAIKSTKFGNRRMYSKSDLVEFLARGAEGS